MPIRLLTALLVALLLPGSVSAIELFKSGRLFVAKSIKETRKTRYISFGVGFQFAPVKALEKEAVKQIENQSPEAKQVFDGLRQVPPEKLDEMTAAFDGGRESLKKFIADEADLSPEAQAEFDSAVDQVDDDDLKLASSLARTAAEPKSATTFILEPFVDVNLKHVSIEVGVPLAGFFMDEAEFALGNVYTDVKWGKHFGEVVGFGVSAGLETAFPTGSSRSDTLALSNLLSASHFLHENLTLAPYLVAGVDVWLVNLQAYGQFNQMLAVRGSGDASSYAQYGAAFVFAPFRFFTVVAELNRLSEISKAARFDGTFATMGLKLSFIGLRLGFAGQLPLAESGEESVGSVAGASIGEPSKWNFLGTLAFDL
jgi:hypothetical protein